MKQRKKTITRQMLDDAREFFSKYENDVTRKAFISNYKKFLSFARSEYDCKTKESCGEHIQDYVNHLTDRGLSPSTIHTYTAPIVLYHGQSLENVSKPQRITAHYKRGRSDNGKKQRSDNDINNPKYARTVEFQKRMGIRRSELKRLKGRDFVYDESGKPCILIERGKGGKKQHQKIFPEDVEFIKTYFDGKESDELIFAPNEFKNKIDYHHLRALAAQRAYSIYLKQCETPEGRAELEKEVRLRYEKTKINKKTGKPAIFKESLITGYYYLRGDCRKLALEKGLPIKYDKLCLMAVSEFHLSHFRCNVSVQSYLLVT